MEEDELEKVSRHKIDAHIKKEIERATNVYDKAFDFYKDQTQKLFDFNRNLFRGFIVVPVILIGIFFYVL